MPGNDPRASRYPARSRAECARAAVDHLGAIPGSLQPINDPGRIGVVTVGDRSLANLPRWKDPDRIAALATLVVAERPGAPAPADWT